MDANSGPAQIRQISATALKAMLEAGETFELVDVRTEDERAIARIEGSRLLDKEYGYHIMGLDRETTLVFYCHHGIRSQAAAEYCIEKGFSKVYNIAGGIDAWSLTVEPSVPRY